MAEQKYKAATAHTPNDNREIKVSGKVLTNRGGSGIIHLEMKSGFLNGHRDIVLGKNIPDDEQDWNFNYFVSKNKMKKLMLFLGHEALNLSVGYLAGLMASYLVSKFFVKLIPLFSVIY